MAYSTQTWATGDTITADKLNHMESGIETANNGSFTVTITYDAETESYVADKTNAEIYAAWQTGANVVANLEGAIFSLNYIDAENATFNSIYMMESIPTIDYINVYTNENTQTVESDTWSYQPT